MKTIRSKIIIAFSAVIAVFIFLLSGIYMFNLNLTDKYEKINNSIVYERSLRDNVWNLIEISFNSFNSGDYTKYYEKLRDIQNIEKQLDLIFEDQSIDKETRLAYRSVKNSLSVVVNSVENTRLDLKENGNIVGISESFQDTVSKFEYIKQNITNLLILETENIARTTLEIKNSNKFITRIMITSITSVIILIIIFIIVFSKKLTIPIKNLSIISKEISDGDLNISVDSKLIKRSDEIGQLSSSFDFMIKMLRKKIADFDNSNKELDFKNKELSEVNKNMEYSQKAVVNLLDDIKEEKDKVEKLVKDLEKFKLAVDNVSDQVIITDPDGIVLYVNKAVRTITGYKEEEVIRKKAGTLWKKTMPDEFYSNMWDTIKNKRQTFIGEMINIRKNGTEYEALISIAPIMDAGGRVIFFVGLEKDITKEKEIDKAKTEFVSLASHQLRTPLSTINWYTEMLLSGDAGEINKEQKSYLEEIYSGNQRMVELVNSLLNVSRLELGTFIIEPEMKNIINLGESVIKEIKPLADNRKQKLDYKYDSDIREVMIDEKLLRMVFQNLLSNSIKYTQEGGSIKLEINKIKNGTILAESIIKEDSLLIKVTDNGYGISKNQQDRIFSKLFRADNIREKDTEGTGLGLYIIKTIVDNSGGKIWFESEENKGTTFFVLMPQSGMKKKEGTKALS